MKRLFRYALPYWRRWSWGVLMLLLTNAAAMSIPQLFRLAVDAIHAGEPVGDLRHIALVLLAVAAAGALFRVLSRTSVFFAARDVELDLRLDFYRHLTSQPPAFFEDRATGDLMSRATNDLLQVRLLLGPGFLNIVNAVVAFAAALPLMLLISPRITLLSMVVYPPALWFMRYLGRTLYVRNRQVNQEMGRISSHVQESLAGAHVIRAFAAEGRRQSLFDERNRAYYRANVRLAWTRSGLFRLGLTMASLGILIAIYLGAQAVMQERMTLGELVAFVEYMALLSWPTLALGWILALWQRGAASMARLNEVFDTPPAIVSGGGDPRDIVPHVSVRELTVRLGEATVLDRVSLEVPAGATVGIVGPIGSGKSTLVRALLRLMDVPAGHLFVGGHDVAALDLKALRRLFGYVPQEHVLFSKSLADNVAFGKPDATRESVLDAVSRAQLLPDVGVLPEGVETLVGERGVTLSGGQKQRTAIARALILDPPILVLDDALSSLDTATEAGLLEDLRRARRGRTTLIVAHRVSAVRAADEILVLDRGVVVERGDHEALVRLGGLYAGITRRQAVEQGLDGEPEAVLPAVQAGGGSQP